MVQSLEQARKWRKANRETLRAYHAERAARLTREDPIGVAEKRKQRRLANLEHIRAQEKASHERNIEKRREYSRSYMVAARKDRPAHVAKIRRAHSLRTKYKLTSEQYDQMFRDQGEACAICRCKEPSPRWHTDHCHTTKKVREILCAPCNLMLGHAKDNSITLINAAAYLAKHEKAQL